jgi:hypothetical protein
MKQIYSDIKANLPVRRSLKPERILRIKPARFKFEFRPCDFG